MKVHFICGYYSDLAHGKKRRPESYWDAYLFCWGVKVGQYKRSFFIHSDNGKTFINKTNFSLARSTFGKHIEKCAKTLDPDDAAILVPVPSKDGVVGDASFRTLDMVKEALNGRTLANSVNGGLRWSEALPPAHEGGTRSRQLLAPLLSVDESLRGKKVILVDDLFSTGSSLLAASDALTAAGCAVLGAITCGKTIYDLNTPHFGEQEFELTEELSDWKKTETQTSSSGAAALR
jgi:phosphoribosylpyrophosphate synthetase